jgi:hypothetical protein
MLLRSHPHIPSPERPPSERPSVIITDDIIHLLQDLHGLEGDRQRDNQGIHDHPEEVQNELRGLADHIHKEVPAVLPPDWFNHQSIGGVLYFGFHLAKHLPRFLQL